MKKIIILVLATMFILPLAVPASAAMSCGKVFIHVGDSAYKVLKRCGEPHGKTVSKIGLSSREEVWYYSFSNRLPYTIIIRNGTVIRIKVE